MIKGSRRRSEFVSLEFGCYRCHGKGCSLSSVLRLTISRYYPAYRPFSRWSEQILPPHFAITIPISSYFIPESRTKLKYSSPFDKRGTGKEEGIRPRVRIEHLDIQLFIEDIQRRVDLTGRLVDQTKFLSRAERVEIVRTTVNRLVGCECRANWSES